MIQLTQFYRIQYGQVLVHGKPLWINPEYILSIHHLDTDVITSEEESKKPVAERPQTKYSLITFGAGGSEGLETENVIESPLQIFDLITKAESF